MKIASPSSSSSSSSKSLNFNHYNGTQNRRMRVADILISDNDNDDDEDEEETNSEHQLIMADGKRRDACRSFRVIFSRWLSLLRRGKKKIRAEKTVVVVVEEEERVRIEEKWKWREKEGGELGCGSSRVRCSMNGLIGESISELMVEERKGDPEVGCESGKYRKEASFNLGAGFGLIYLIAMNRNELSKMTELRKEMELFLQDCKEELHGNDTLSKPPKFSNTVAYSTTDVEDSVNSTGRVSLQTYASSSNLPYSASKLKPDQNLNENLSREEECVEGIDQLEAEFEAEFERLQLHLDTDYLRKPHREETVEVAVEETAPGGSLSASFGEVVDPYEAYAEGDCGVPPHELKIRLHELLQEKQEERMKELEAALGCAKQKLREKEIEVSWWKDTAQLFAKHVVKS